MVYSPISYIVPDKVHPAWASLKFLKLLSVFHLYKLPISPNAPVEMPVEDPFFSNRVINIDSRCYEK